MKRGIVSEKDLPVFQPIKKRKRFRLLPTFHLHAFRKHSQQTIWETVTQMENRWARQYVLCNMQTLSKLSWKINTVIFMFTEHNKNTNLKTTPFCK